MLVCICVEFAEICVCMWAMLFFESRCMWVDCQFV